MPTKKTTKKAQTVFLVIEETPDYNSEIVAYATEAAADGHAESVVSHYLKEGTKLCKEGTKLWVSGDGTVCVEVREVAVN